ncbi:hypothetical protein AX15_003363 [Amanita polypyramis BW_CC]|nr:hypothetical protein AX15_003363 [Amanita polypyramis BW_CC]
MTATTQWLRLLDRYSPATIEFIGTSIIQFVFFWIVSAIYIALPYVLPEFSTRHKLQKLAKRPTPSELWHCLSVVARNQAVSSILHVILILVRGRAIYRQFILPGILEVFRDVVLAILFHDVLFYYVHCFFHRPSVYQSFHKVHHRFTAPVALAAQYATITEHLFANLMPVILPLMIFKAHVISFWTFLAIGLMQTTTVHSGFDFFGGLGRAHDAHHEKFVVEFGTVGLLDWLHGTGRDDKVKSFQ